jgi:DNA-binding NtrC family response regulator
MQADTIRVLIVDDDPSIVRMLAGFVNQLALESVEANGAPEALRLASQEEVHIAVVDNHMPEMEGIDLVNALRRLNPDLEVILITGDFSPQFMNQAIDQGAYDCLWKPVDFRQFQDSLRALRERVLSRTGSRTGK